MQDRIFQFTTDTATLCVFDVGALKHRIADSADWWCLRADQLQEVNSGNAAFIDLGSDGTYNGTLQFSPLSQPQLRVGLIGPTGRFFIGAGEETTSEGMEPDCTRGGVLLEIPRGGVVLQVASQPNGELRLAFARSPSEASNSFTEPLRLT